MSIWAVLQQLGDPTRAVENARAASCELSRRRVEREEVALYLEEFRLARESSAPALPEAARA